MSTYLIFGMSYAFACAVQPGPFLAYLVGLALANGWRRALPAAFAPLLSDGPVILLTLLVLTQMPEWLAPVLRMAGGCFLLYLAWGALQSWHKFDAGKLTEEASGRQGFAKAVTIQLLSPGPYIAWSLVMGPLLIQGWREAPANGVALLGGFYTVMVLTLIAIVILLATARKLGPQVNRVLIGISALTLAAFGGYQLWAGLRVLL
jgi:threonine/homoserine/homoserine lactone efflux protein